MNHSCLGDVSGLRVLFMGLETIVNLQMWLVMHVLHLTRKWVKLVLVIEGWPCLFEAFGRLRVEDGALFVLRARGKIARKRHGLSRCRCFMTERLMKWCPLVHHRHLYVLREKQSPSLSDSANTPEQASSFVGRIALPWSQGPATAQSLCTASSCREMELERDLK